MRQGRRRRGRRPRRRRRCGEFRGVRRAGERAGAGAARRAGERRGMGRGGAGAGATAATSARSGPTSMPSRPASPVAAAPSGWCSSSVARPRAAWPGPPTRAAAPRRGRPRRRPAAARRRPRSRRCPRARGRARQRGRRSRRGCGPAAPRRRVRPVDDDARAVEPEERPDRALERLARVHGRRHEHAAGVAAVADLELPSLILGVGVARGDDAHGLVARALARRLRASRHVLKVCGEPGRRRARRRRGDCRRLRVVLGVRLGLGPRGPRVGGRRRPRPRGPFGAAYGLYALNYRRAG